jgi:hypothetical protein
MASEWAMTLARKTAERWWANENESQKTPWVSLMAEALDAARAEGRREEAEKCMEIVYGFYDEAEDGATRLEGAYEAIRARLREVKGE